MHSVLRQFLADFDFSVGRRSTGKVALQAFLQFGNLARVYGVELGNEHDLFGDVAILQPWASFKAQAIKEATKGKKGKTLKSKFKAAMDEADAEIADPRLLPPCAPTPPPTPAPEAPADEGEEAPEEDEAAPEEDQEAPMASGGAPEQRYPTDVERSPSVVVTSADESGGWDDAYDAVELEDERLCEELEERKLGKYWMTQGRTDFIAKSSLPLTSPNLRPLA